MLSGDKKTLKIIDFGLSERIRPPGAQYKRHVGVCRCCQTRHVECRLLKVAVVHLLGVRGLAFLNTSFSVADRAIHGGRAVDKC